MKSTQELIEVMVRAPEVKSLWEGANKLTGGDVVLIIGVSSAYEYDDY